MNTEVKSTGARILGWWSVHIGDRDRSRARALAAALRRAGTVEALLQPEVQVLARDLNIGPASASELASLVQVLAHIRTHGSGTLAQRMGGPDPALSNLRFQRLMRSDGADLCRAVIRALPMVGRQCNVAALGQDLLQWNEATRIRWSFHYFGAAAPQDQEGLDA